MTLALRYALRSDVGLLREGNEDSAYAGPHLLAIADGMGGHAAGEVASAVAISAMVPLDKDMPDQDMLDALAVAVSSASGTLHQMSVADPAVEGMGTTLTAMLWSGARVALCHIGDSRAYMLRDGEFHQITRDQMKRIVQIQINRLRPRLEERHITLHLSDLATEFLANLGYDPQYGARPLKRVIQKEVENRVARGILDGTVRDGDTVEIDVKDGKLTLEAIH